MFRTFSSATAVASSSSSSTTAAAMSLAVRFAVPCMQTQQRFCSTLNDLQAAAKQMQSSNSDSNQRGFHRRGGGGSGGGGPRRHHSGGGGGNDRHYRGGGGGGGPRRNQYEVESSSSSSNNTISNRGGRDFQQQRSPSPSPEKKSESTEQSKATQSASSSSSQSTQATRAASPSSENNAATTTSTLSSSSSSSSSASSASTAPASSNSDVRSLELKLRHAYDRLEKLLQRAGGSGGSNVPYTSLAESDAATVAVPLAATISKGSMAVSAQENPHVEQEFKSVSDVAAEGKIELPAEMKKPPPTLDAASAARATVPVSFSRTEFGVARAEIVGVVASPVVVMKDKTLGRDFARMMLRVSSSSSSSSSSQQQQQQQQNANNNTMTIEVRIYGDVLLRSVVNGGIPAGAQYHTVVHVSGRLMMTSAPSPTMIVAVSDEAGSVSVVVVDAK